MIIGLALFGCQAGGTTKSADDQGDPAPDVDPPDGAGGDAPSSLRIGRERRLLTSADLAQLAFKRDGQRFLAEHVTHRAAVDGGRISFTPYHRDAAGTRTAPPLTLQTTAIQRGADLYGDAVRATSIDAARGELVIDRDQAVEVLANFEGGLEQSWHFDVAPAGAGDLTVKVAVAGAPYLTTTPGGLHFGRAGELGFQYGHATWIDASGAETPIDVVWRNRQVEIVVPEDVLENSTYPAVLDPVVSAEVAVDTPVSGGWTGRSAQRAAIASSGAGFLVAWQDSRSATTDIYATRLSAVGAVLDATGIALDTQGDAANNPAVAFVGSEYVVVWDNGAVVRAARVSAAGAILGQATIGNGVEPKIAARGGEALVVYREGSDVRAAVFSGGAFGAPIAVTSGASATGPAVAANPSGDYLVTWSDGATTPDLWGRFVTPMGAAPAAAFTVIAGAGSQTEPAVAWNGTEFVVVWTNNSAGVDIFGIRVSTAGVAAPAAGVRLTSATGNQFQPALACEAAGTCLVTWTDRRNFATLANDTFGVRVDAALAVVGSEITVASANDDQREPAVTTSADGWRVTWDETRHGATVTVFSAAIASDGTVGTGSNVVIGNNEQERPTVAGSTTQFFVAWADSRSLGQDIFSGRFNSSGAALDNPARAVSTASRLQYNPDAVFNGTNFVTFWEDNRNGGSDIYAARTNATGTLLDASGLAISTAAGNQTSPATAFGAGTTFVVWQDNRNGNLDIYGALVSATGVVTVADIPVCVGAGNQRLPAVAYSSSGVFLVAWHDNRTGTDRTYVSRVTTAGAVLDSCGVALTSGSGAQSTAAVAFGAGTFLVTWHDSSPDVFGARVVATPSALTVSDPAGFTIAGTAGVQERDTSVAFVATPGSFFVTWTQGNDIVGRIVRPTGAFDGGLRTIASSADVEARPYVAAGAGSGLALVTYERDVPALQTTRVVTRRLQFGSLTGSTCTSNGQCGTGFCVDGYCCDTACGGNNTGDCQACSTSRGALVNGTCAVIPASRSWRCRGYADTFCDLIEVCNGVDPTCPADLGRRQGIACTLAGGGTGVCPANDPSGAPHICQ